MNATQNARTRKTAAEPDTSNLPQYELRLKARKAGNYDSKSGSFRPLRLLA